MSWEAEDLSLFQDIKLPDLLLTMSQENISVHDIAIRYRSPPFSLDFNLIKLMTNGLSHGDFNC